MTVEFQLFGQNFVGLNGGPIFKFTEALSLVVNCRTQREVDYYWEKLSADGGKKGQCGWLKDKYGLSWQVVPRVLSLLMQDKDPGVRSGVTSRMLKMKKLVISELKGA